MSALPEIVVSPPTPKPHAAAKVLHNGNATSAAPAGQTIHLSGSTVYKAPPQSPTSTEGYAKPNDPSDDEHGFNAYTFLNESILNKTATFTMVLIKSVTNSGGLSPIGYVDVQIMVHQVDASGNIVPHGIIHNLPYMRIQGGANAVIMDPQVGDIGVAAFCSHDISTVKKNKAPSHPGSFRRYDHADGIYLHAVVASTPTQYVQFNSAGINITSPQQVTINGTNTISLYATNINLHATSQIWLDAPNVLIDGILSQGTGPRGGTATLLGPVAVVHDVTAQGTSVHSHVHTGVQSGSNDTGPPA